MHQGKALMLDFGNSTVLKALAGTRSNQICYIDARPKVPSDLKALLIRPYGYIAWAADDTTDEAVAHWFA